MFSIYIFFYADDCEFSSFVFMSNDQLVNDMTLKLLRY